MQDKSIEALSCTHARHDGCAAYCAAYDEVSSGACLTFSTVRACCDRLLAQGFFLQQTGNLTGGGVLWSHEA